MSDLFRLERRGWNTQRVLQLFGVVLANRVLSLAIPITQDPNIRTWQSSCRLILVTRELYDIYKEEPMRSMDGSWIWRLKIHPRISLFL